MTSWSDGIVSRLKHNVSVNTRKPLTSPEQFRHYAREYGLLYNQMATTFAPTPASALTRRTVHLVRPLHSQSQQLLPFQTRAMMRDRECDADDCSSEPQHYVVVFRGDVPRDAPPREVEHPFRAMRGFLDSSHARDVAGETEIYVLFRDAASAHEARNRLHGYVWDTGKPARTPSENRIRFVRLSVHDNIRQSSFAGEESLNNTGRPQMGKA